VGVTEQNASARHRHVVQLIGDDARDRSLLRGGDVVSPDQQSRDNDADAQSVKTGNVHRDLLMQGAAGTLHV